ncbi:MAG: hypothetical protein ACLFS7_07645, partial [Desulfosudaceae bacterium]
YDAFTGALIPAKAGIQNYPISLDPGLRRGDAIRKISTFYETIKNRLSTSGVRKILTHKAGLAINNDRKSEFLSLSFQEKTEYLGCSLHLRGNK